MRVSPSRFMAVLWALLIGAYGMAQTGATIVAPYSMGFEESEDGELSNWTLNPGAAASLCPEAWYVGTAAKSSGKRALYISNNQGESAQYGSATCVQYAYRDFVIAQGTYEVSFDWVCLGNASSYLYAGLAPAANVNLEASATSSAIPSGVLSWCSALGKMSGTSLWRNASMRMNSNGRTTYRLFFVWASSNQDTTIAYPLSAVIDNIQICSANCAKPKSVTAETTCDSLIVHWSGTSEKYVFEYRKRGQDWSTPAVYYTDGCVVSNLEEGLYDVRVRGICNDVDTSAYTYQNSIKIFCPEKHCINYVNLHDSTGVVTCYYGSYNNPQAQIGVVDETVTQDSRMWRHSVYWEPDEYDIRTGNQLPTIPDGELASVRLGNWNNGGEAECIEYLYTADIENAAIMLLKYAIVLEDPSHGTGSNPYFSVEIFDQYGTLLSPTCGVANFYADMNRKDGGWHVCSNAPGATSPVSWKEWTTIGLNLAELGVQTGDVLTIRLTTKDCAWSAHFGYAYFTLGCAAATIKSTSCGSEAVLSVEAPDGFRYEWYNNQGTLVDSTKVLQIAPGDTSTYRCRLVFLENEECDFSLYTQSFPRFPVSSFSYTYDPANCENRVYFHNHSHIITVEEKDTTHHYDQGCDSYEWEMMPGVKSGAQNPMYVFPQTGGLFPVTLYAGISNGACIEDTTVWVDVPAIGDSEQTIDTTICDGNYVQFGKYYAALTGLYYDSLVSRAGCDSVIILNLQLNPVSSTTLPDTTICAETKLCIDGDCYKFATSGEFVRFRTNQYGCDSTIHMQVHVLDSILPTVTVTEPTEQLGTGSLTVGGTGYSYYTLNGERHDASDNYITGLNGGIFFLEFYNDFGCMVARSDTMNYECLGITPGDWTFACTTTSEMSLRFEVDSGIPTTYNVLFDSIGHAVGFADQIAVGYAGHEGVITIPMAAGVKPGVYPVTLVFDNVLPRCEDIVFSQPITVHFPASVIFQRWDDVLSVTSAELNGGFDFIGFQWMKNGNAISGATLSYYWEEGGLDLTADYEVRLLMPDSTWFTTCTFQPQPYSAPQLQNKKIIENQRLVIIHNGERYNAQGIKLESDEE
ncbi:MAG: hypothetical protein SOT07_02565 [Paludibacteraceae bacterium]|nr:hypothetical protein [Paludibacteraceae bacterium]